MGSPVPDSSTGRTNSGRIRRFGRSIGRPFRAAWRWVTFPLFKRWPFRRPKKLTEGPDAGKRKRKPATPFRGEHDQFPALQDLFTGVEATVLKPFQALDEEANRQQLIHRRFRVALIIGSGFTATFGAVQASYEMSAWPGFVLAVLGAITASIARAQQQLGPQSKYLLARAKAEELRSLYYQYLAQIDIRNGRDLERRVADIRYTGGPSGEEGGGP